jgi:hypothetical protein
MCFRVWLKYENVINVRLFSHTGELQFSHSLLFVQLYSLRTQPFVHTNATSFQKQIQQRGKKKHSWKNEHHCMFVEFPVVILI